MIDYMVMMDFVPCDDKRYRCVDMTSNITSYSKNFFDDDDDKEDDNDDVKISEWQQIYF